MVVAWQAAVAGVFFYGIDGDVCVENADKALFNASVAAFRQACAALEASGKKCMLSMVNSFFALPAVHNVSAPACPFSEHAVVELMAGVRWSRYYQHW
jgi:hypothetical protein